MENVMYSNAAIMSHNIALAATALNIGSCYIWGATAAISKDEEILNNYIQQFSTPRGIQLNRKLYSIKLVK